MQNIKNIENIKRPIRQNFYSKIVLQSKNRFAKGEIDGQLKKYLRIWLFDEKIGCLGNYLVV